MKVNRWKQISSVSSERQLTLSFSTEAVGDSVPYVHVAEFGGISNYSMSRQSTDALTRAEVENRFADFISEIRHGQ